MKKDYTSPELDLVRFSFQRLLDGGEEGNFDPSSLNDPREEFNPGLDD